MTREKLVLPTVVSPSTAPPTDKLLCTSANIDIDCVCGLMSVSDVNECEQGSHSCSDICVNTIGSYYCDCPLGYELESSSHDCRGMYQRLEVSEQ